MNQEIHKAINWLDRSDIETLLETHGFAVYDTESTDELRESLRENVMDGTIPASDIT